MTAHHGASGISIGDITNVARPAGADAEKRSEAPPVSRILILGSNPDGTSRLRLDREARAIEDALGAAPASRRRFELLLGWASSALDIQQDLFRHRPELVHYSGHGSAAGELVLEAQRFRDLGRREPTSCEMAGGAPAPVAALARLLAAAPGARCVVLNACHSAALAEAVAEQADCAIGMAAAVSDDGAVAFAWGFYHALAQGESVAAAAADLASVQMELIDPSRRQCPRLFNTRRHAEGAAGIRWAS